MSGAIPAAVTTGPGEDTDLIVAAVEVAGQAKTTNVAEFDNLASSSSLCATDMDVANLSENTSGDKGEEAKESDDTHASTASTGSNPACTTIEDGAKITTIPIEMQYHMGTPEEMDYFKSEQMMDIINEVW